MRIFFDENRLIRLLAFHMKYRVRNNSDIRSDHAKMSENHHVRV